MGLAVYLKKLLTSVINNYVNFFSKTYGVALTLMLCYFVVILLLMKFNPPTSEKQVSILSYFYFRYSRGDVYFLIDLSKTIYLFFVALMSLSLCRLSGQGEDQESYITLGKVISKIKVVDLLFFLFTLILASAIDFGLVSLEGLTTSMKISFNLKHYINSNLFFIRIYAPLFLFSVAIYKTYTGKTPLLDSSKICLLFISFWVFNEFTYESFLLARNQLFNLLLVPFSSEKAYLIESILGLFLMAIYMVGYHATMTVPFMIFEEEAVSVSEGKSEASNPK